jgi:hypothetical protein
MADDPRRTKPEPPQQAGSVISMADRDQERRHEAARRLAEKHNAAVRPPPDATAYGRVLINSTSGDCPLFG